MTGTSYGGGGGGGQHHGVLGFSLQPCTSIGAPEGNDGAGVGTRRGRLQVVDDDSVVRQSLLHGQELQQPVPAAVHTGQAKKNK